VDTAAAYAADRVQFGRPIGQFQAVKHRCADMLCHLEEARAAAWDAARGGDEKESALAAAVAGAIAPARAFQVAKDCIQVHGGIGFTWEHDAHLYLRRVTTTYHLLDGAGPWRAAVADFAGQGVRRSLSFDLPAEAEQYRPSVRAFVEEVHALPKEAWNRCIADAGYLVPHWPEP
jgi:alkylation response protein AidB-like acyl-CoA dehydrogenase